MKTYLGKCHCGAVSFEVDTDLTSTFRCNCSFCVRRGAIVHRVPAQQFRLLSEETGLTTYGARDFSKHFFCPICGIQCFTRITRANESSVAVNVGCLPDVNPEELTPRLFDGANLL